MKAAYEANPNMGDPQSVQGQMVENGERLDKLHVQLKRYHGLLDEVDGKGPSTPFSQKRKTSTSSSASQATQPPPQHSQTSLTSGGRHSNSQRNSISEDSLSRSPSDSSFSQTTTPHASSTTPPSSQTPVQNNNPSNNSPGKSKSNLTVSSAIATMIKNQQNSSYNHQNGVSNGVSITSDSQKSSSSLKPNRYVIY